MEALIAEQGQFKLPVEFILYDDGSAEKYQAVNKKYQQYPAVSFYASKENSGRSLARNRLSELAQGEFLLYIDCDSLPVRKDFLRAYCQNTDHYVVVGGRKYLSNCSPKFRLHHKYGLKREISSLPQRKANPYKAFYSSNFMVKKSLFAQIKFDERIKQYGHEDTVLGIQLKRKGIVVGQIENEVFHALLDEDAVFINKQKEAVENLVTLSADFSELKDISSLLKMLEKYSPIIHFIPRFIINIQSSAFKKICLAFHSLFFLQLYKLTVAVQASCVKENDHL